MSDNLPSEVANSEIQRTLSEEFQRIISDSKKEIDIRSLLQLILDPRQIVKEEFEKQLRNLSNGKRYSEPRSLELHFSCNVSEVVWTGESIKGEGNSSILVTLIDFPTGKAVKSGPEASAKVEIVILDGSFDKHDWTAEEFSQSIIKEKNGKNILKGNVYLKLKEGVGLLGDLSIVHNRNWKRVSEVRLGARLMDNFQNIRVKEAKTGTFTMRDKRMKANRKDVEVLSLMDNVWCLKNIGKRGPIVDRLTERGIETIKDFLSLYFVRPEELRRILGRGWSDMKLKATIDHGLKCKKLEKRYLAPHPNSQEKYGVVFTEVFNVLGVFKGSQFIPFDQLPEALKCYSLKLVKSAFDNKEEGVVWDETIPPLVSPTTATTCASTGPFSSMMGADDVGADAAVGTAFLSREVVEEVTNASVFDTTLQWSSHELKNGHDPAAEGIIPSYAQLDAMDQNDPNNIFQVPDMISMDMDEFNWNLFVRPEELRRILGRGWSDKKLKATIDHVLKCKNLENRYLALNPNSQENYGVVFTEVFNDLGIFKECQFIPFDQLPETLKCDARSGVKSAFDNKEDGVVWDETTPPLVSPTCASSNGPFSSSSMMGEDVSSEATDGASFLNGGEEGEVDRNASSVLDTSPLFSSHGWGNWGRISANDKNDANEFNWNNVLRVLSFNNEDHVYL